MPHLIVLEAGENNWSAYAPDLPGVVATGRNEADTERRMREALALHLYEMKRDGDVLPAQISTPDHYPDRAKGDIARLVDPAPLNPVSLEIERVLAATGKSLRQLAQETGISQPTLSRLQNPFYWGQSVASLRTLARVLGAELEIRFRPSSAA
jgi:antitoxin HicB